LFADSLFYYLFANLLPNTERCVYFVFCFLKVDDRTSYRHQGIVVNTSRTHLKDTFNTSYVVAILMPLCSTVVNRHDLVN